MCFNILESRLKKFVTKLNNIMDLDKYKGLTNSQIALICATEIVTTEIKKEWNFEDDSVKDVTMMFANRFFAFLENADNDREYEE